MTIKKHEELSFMDVIKSEKNVSLFFLGVGLCLFFLNISSMLSFLPSEYSHVAFDISVFSSMLIILYSVYNLYKKEK